MDTKSLSYFVQAAETLNFTKAAKLCYISQTAMSLAIGKMEDELGFLLFERNNRSMKLTLAGAEFYDWAKGTLSGYELIRAHGQKLATGAAGTLKIGTSSPYEAMWFFRTVQLFRKHCPDVKIEQRILPPDSLINALRSRELDAVVAPPYAYRIIPEARTFELAQFRQELVMNASNPMATMEEIPLPMLSSCDCLIMSFGGQEESERQFHQLLAEHGIRFAHMQEMNSVEEILLQVNTGDAIGFLPSVIADHVDEPLVHRSLKDCGLSFPFAFSCLSTNRNPALDAICLLLSQHIGKD